MTAPARTTRARSQQKSHAARHARALPRHGGRRDAVALAEELSAVLDAPLVGYFGGNESDHLRACGPDGCAECAPIRAAVYHCQWCGYDGPPLVDGCDCPETHASNIRFAADRLKTREFGAKGQFSEADLLRILQQEADRPWGRCKPRAAGSGQPFGCSHGTRWCPACGSVAGKVTEAAPEMLIKRLREIRTLLQRRANP